MAEIEAPATIILQLWRRASKALLKPEKAKEDGKPPEEEASDASNTGVNDILSAKCFLSCIE